MIKTVEKETLVGVRQLVLVKIETLKSKQTEEEYLNLTFSMCVQSDPDDIRKNKFINVPIYCSKLVAKEAFEGRKKSDLEGLEFNIEVEFSPSIRRHEGKVYTDWRASIKSIEEVMM